MLTFIDDILNRITMYRLTLYVLLALLFVAVTLSAFNVFSYDPLLILFSAAYILATCWVLNTFFAKVFNLSANVESVYITAFILVFLIDVPASFSDEYYLSMALFASLAAISSKYIFTIKKKHIFNPAAFGVAVTYLLYGQSATWWIGTAWMAPFAALGAFMIVRKIRRFDPVFAFFLVALATLVALKLSGTLTPWAVVERALLDTAMIFFAGVMLTEPLTMPASSRLQMAYGALVGFLWSGIYFGPFHFTPELALLAGNVFSFLVSPSQRIILTLKEKVKAANDTYDFVFKADEKPPFKAGQYLEWTLGHPRPDSRGIRRYFTIASSPTEDGLRLGVKFYPSSSTFKKALLSLESGMTLSASSLAGDFTLPKDASKKLAFIAGGIGVTPFRSMAKYLSDTGEERDIVMLYSNKTEADIAYRHIFTEAEKIGWRTVYTVNAAPAGPGIRVGMIDKDMIIGEIPDFKERLFYISGPHGMVTAFQKSLKEIGVPRSQIKIDYFPGFV